MSKAAPLEWKNGHNMEPLKEERKHSVYRQTEHPAIIIHIRSHTDPSSFTYMCNFQ